MSTEAPSASEVLSSGQFNTTDAQQAPESEIVAEGAIAVNSDDSEVATPTPEETAAAEAAKKLSTEEVKAKIEADKFAAKFAALSRKEKQMRDREKAIAAREAQIAEAEQTKTKYSSELDAFKARIRKEPVRMMEEYGLTRTELAEILLNDGEPTEKMKATDAEKAIQAQIKALEDKLAAKEAKEEEDRYNATLNAFKTNIANHINNNAADYELVQANDATELVYQVIEEHHASTGEILDIKRAADAVEAHLLEEAKKLIERPNATKSEAAKAAPSAKTLTNASATKPSPVARYLSDDESKAEAAKLIKWQD
jgi:hypothetical protein